MLLSELKFIAILQREVYCGVIGVNINEDWAWSLENIR